MPLLSEVEFASWYSYCPRGSGELAAQGLRIRDALKSDGVFVSKYGSLVATQAFARALADGLSGSPIADFFTGDVGLVPVPGSSLLVEGGLWVPSRLATAMVKNGLGHSVLPCIRRAVPVRKSAFAPAAERPTAEVHYRSLAVDPVLHWPARLILIDDVVTRGATLLAAASRLREAAPHAEVVAFAMLRTMSNPAEFAHWRAPVRGRISTVPWGTKREP